MERQQLRHDEITATRRINEEKRLDDLFKMLANKDPVVETLPVDSQTSATSD